MAMRDLGPQHQARKPRIVCWGELLWDVFPDQAHLGGSAANVAFHAHRLGAEGRLISRVGNDTWGQRAIDQLRHTGVNVDEVTVDQTRPTGQARVTLSKGEPAFRLLSNVAWDRISVAATGLAALRRADAFCFGTLAQRTLLADRRLRQVLRMLRSGGASGPTGGAPGRRPLCILDLNLRQPHVQKNVVLQAAEFADVVKMNEAEADYIAEATGAQDPLAWLFRHTPAKLIALTRGANGASLFGRQVSVHASVQPALGGDPVGAGDAFVAALAVGLCRGNSLPHLLHSANRQASWVANQAGAMPL